MKRILIVLFIFLFGVFIVIQFFQPGKNLSQPDENLITNCENMTDDLKNLLKNSCFDCHSNNTRYLWYHKIAPVSWLVQKDIKEGKKKLNFSEWKTMDAFDKITALEEIKHEIERETMPIKPYLIMHPGSKIGKKQKEALIAWIDKKGDELIKE